MKLEQQRPLPVSQAQAWAALNDTEVLKACIPGCQSLAQTDAQHYEAVVVAAIGPVKATFKGRLALADLRPPESYRLDFEGSGGMAGHGKGSAQVRLEATGADTCTLHYVATAQVGGKIAQIGQRLVDMAAQRMAREFFTAFDNALAGSAA